MNKAIENIISNVLKEILQEEPEGPKSNDGSSYYKNKTCVIRTSNAGVFVGEVAVQESATIILNNCRRLWYWDGASSLSQLATEGVTRPENCKFSVLTNAHQVLGVIEVIPVTAAAKKLIYGVKEWKQ